MKFPSPIKPGDYIGVTAPSEGITKQINLKRLDNVKNNLAKLGYKYTETKNVRTLEKGRSSSASQRVEQFMNLWENNEVKAIISAAGGFFLNEMIEKLDFKKLKNIEPKWFQGYSDNTGLTFLLTTISDIATIYGPTIKDFGMRKLHPVLTNSLEIMKGKSLTQKSFEKCETNEWIERIDPYEEYNLVCKNSWKNLNDEEKIKFKGRSIGGCFDSIVDFIGTKYDNVSTYIEKYKKDGIIWFLEVCEMSTAEISLHLWQMKNAGYFKNCQGIIFGRPLMVKQEYGITYEETLKESLSNLNIPVIYDADIGHISPQMPIVSGAILEVECENGKGKITNYFE